MNEELIGRIGKVISGFAQRDSIHMAVIPMRANVALQPGQKVYLDDNGAYPANYASEVSIGIVDPFLTRNVEADEKFWLFINPGSITGMRHHWIHPEIDKNERIGHEEWLRQFAEDHHYVYDEMIATCITAGDLISTDQFYGPKETDQEEEFWSHLEALTGLTFDNVHREKMYWGCSC